MTAGVRSSALGPVEIRAGAEQDFGRLHNGFGKRGVGMDGHRHVAGKRGLELPGLSVVVLTTAPP